MKIKPLLLLTLAAAFPASFLYAQGNGGPAGPPHQTLQLITALDTDGDGIISATEIANATASLKTLDKNGDGELTPDEYGFPQPSGGQNGARRHGGNMPPPPPGGQQQGQGTNQSPQGPPPPPQLERWAIVRALANSDGIITADAIANAPALLKKVDKNGDGQLSPMEYGIMHSSPLVWALDTDGDGIISASEIANAATSLKLLDKNGDGQLTEDEYAFPAPPAPPQSGKSNKSANQPEPPPDPVLQALDTDGDGIISAAEIAAAPQSLKTLDKNGDGQLGPGEYNPPPPPQQ